MEEPIEDEDEEAEKPEAEEDEVKDEDEEGAVEEEKDEEEKKPKTKKVDKTTWDWELCNQVFLNKFIYLLCLFSFPGEADLDEEA